ncbi:hypothetical protein [Nocardioides sp. SYSU D00038]|uniref:hypothetical protein n=1 Tax=Nocardioides sp. SYSU D00038 TaxID=2812554 RepID=UPI00196789E4|nr:hypothetical protein [Nocardioides sp. SYSU D00038]
MTQPDGPDEPREPSRDAPGPEDVVGSVAEEAAQLFGALGEWARAHAGQAGGLGGVLGGGAGERLGGLAERAAAAAVGAEEHLATGAPECTWCPVCRTVHVVRQASPEVRAHLATAATSLLQAAAGLLATAVPPGATSAERGPGGVERIDLDPDADDGADWPEPEGGGQ